MGIPAPNSQKKNRSLHIIFHYQHPVLQVCAKSIVVTIIHCSKFTKTMHGRVVAYLLVLCLLFVSCTIKIAAETTNITWTDALYNFSRAELQEATEIWKDFQRFALKHSSLPSQEALRLCNRFEGKDMRNFSRIGMDLKGPLANRPTRVLFLTTKRSLLLLNDRWYFELYAAMANQPNVEVTMWGTGCPGYRDEETTKQNLLRWFAETTFDIIHSTW